jgi:peptidoglycan/LPS O-acetylase OafA/YrhL
VKRVESLDYLRGLMAISVVIYHYSSWSTATLGGEYLFGKLGIYAVSIFYILSGLSLTIVYQNKITHFSDIISFFIKRLFRIFPLFWLVVTVFILIKVAASVLGNEEFSIPLYKIFLNYTLLFGFIEPSAYLTTGAWSIGNEMVFYAIFPIVFILSSKYPWVLPLTILLSIVAGLYFAFWTINEDVQLKYEWPVYINPFNQLFLFMAGIAIGKWGEYIQNIEKRMGYFILLLALLIFWLYPAEGDKIQIVTGVERVVLSLSSIIFVLFVYILNPQIKSLPSNILAFLGQGCYSIYLLHPLIAIPIVAVFSKLGFDDPVAYIIAFFATLVISGLTFTYLEKPMMNVGKVVSQKLLPKV